MRNKFAAICVLALAAASGLALQQYRASDTYYLKRAAATGDPTRALIRDMPNVVAESGVEKAVALTTDALEHHLIGVDDCHLVFHLIGHESYRVYGSNFDAIARANPHGICLDGYLHGVEAEIASTGDREEQKKFCTYEKTKGLITGEPCFHGVGHSAFELTKNVSKALAYCDSLGGGPEPDLTNCYRGVFSEIGNELNGYDTNTGLSVSALQDASQGLVAKPPYTVCAAVKSTYRPDCYTQLSKLVYRPAAQDPTFGIETCPIASMSKTVQSVCARIVTSLATRQLLDAAATTTDIAALINALPSSVRKDALDGAREGYEGEDIKSAWPQLCPYLDDTALRAACAAR